MQQPKRMTTYWEVFEVIISLSFAHVIIIIIIIIINNIIIIIIIITIFLLCLYCVFGKILSLKYISFT